MKGHSEVGPVRDARAVANKIEQIAHEVSRTTSGLSAINGDIRVFYRTVVAPLISSFKSTPGSPSAKV